MYKTVRGWRIWQEDMEISPEVVDQMLKDWEEDKARLQRRITSLEKVEDLLFEIQKLLKERLE